MKPSQSTRGQEWLEQFDEADSALAAMLIDSIRFVPAGEIIAGVRRSIERLVDSGAVPNPAAMLPVLAIEDLRSKHGGALPPSPVAFADFDPSQDLSGAPGSEAPMANMIREIARAHRAKYVSHPITLDRLRSAKARSLSMVTDYVGSGRQVTDYVNSWLRNPTIRSWRSGGFVQVVVVAYGARTEGGSVVRACSGVSHLEFAEVAPTVHDWELAIANPQLADLCTRYAAHGKLRGMPLGHRNSGGLFATAMSVPNNLPAILIHRSKRWKPFFDGRSATADLADEVGDYVPTADLSALLVASRQPRLAARIDSHGVPDRWLRLVAALGLLPASSEQLAGLMKLPVAEAQQTLDALNRLGLAEVDGRITTDGRRTLAAHRRKARTSVSVLGQGAGPYYPQTLR